MKFFVKSFSLKSDLKSNVRIQLYTSNLESYLLVPVAYSTQPREHKGYLRDCSSLTVPERMCGWSGLSLPSNRQT